jgi:hypothetical protein
MRSRTLLASATAALALSAVALPAVALPAQAVTTEYVDRATFDAAPDVTTSSIRVAGETRGELGGYLDATVVAKDGSLPTGSEVCEPASVHAVLTLSAGETLTVRVRGTACTSFAGDAITVNAAFRTRHLRYSGTEHTHSAGCRPRVVGDGLLAMSNSLLGGQASFSASIRW